MLGFTKLKKVETKEAVHSPRTEDPLKYEVDFTKFKKVDSPKFSDYVKINEPQSSGAPLLPEGKTQEDISNESRVGREEELAVELANKPKEKEQVVVSDDSIIPEKTSREVEVEQIGFDEGIKQESYMDSVGKPTAGVGHLLTLEELRKYPVINIKGKYVGTPVPKEVVDAWFEKDIKIAEDDVKSLTEKHSLVVPDEVDKILLNMSFNLGRTRLSKFKKMFAHLANNNYEKAADEMINSDWYKQVGRRSKRLVARMRGIESTQPKEEIVAKKNEDKKAVKELSDFGNKTLEDIVATKVPETEEDSGSIIPENIFAFAKFYVGNLIGLEGAGADVDVAKFGTAQKSVLKQAMQNAQKEGRSYIKYSDYPDMASGDRPDNFYRAKREDRSLLDLVKESAKDPVFEMFTTTGVFNFEANEDGSYTILPDKYDFNKSKSGGKDRKEAKDKYGALTHAAQDLAQSYTFSVKGKI